MHLWDSVNDVFEMILNYWVIVPVIVERYPFPNEVVDGSIPVMKSSLYFIERN